MTLMLFDYLHMNLHYDKPWKECQTQEGKDSKPECSQAKYLGAGVGSAASLAWRSTPWVLDGWCFRHYCSRNECSPYLHLAHRLANTLLSLWKVSWRKPPAHWLLTSKGSLWNAQPLLLPPGERHTSCTSVPRVIRKLPAPLTGQKWGG